MYIVAGLGNPGIAYRKSRHNAGFLALDLLAERLHVRVAKRAFSGLLGEGVVNGERIVLVKPQTYMNLSGDCVQRVLHFYKAKPEDLLVLYDDIDLPVGAIRIRSSGSAGTHNGMRSVIANAGSEQILRVRVGVGRADGPELRDYVLGRPSKAEQALLDAALDHAAEAAEWIVSGRLADAQARFNKKHEGRGAGEP